MKLIDLTGERFGRLVVTGQAAHRGPRVMWMCHCDCGQTREVAARSLKTRNTRSCGCLAREARQYDGLACERPTKKYPSGRTGVPAGYSAHQAAGQDPCQPCREAWSVKMHDRWVLLGGEERKKVREANRAAGSKYRLESAEKAKTVKTRYRDANKSIMRAAKAAPCHDCGNTYPYYVMQFDHVPGRGKKKFNIGTIGPTHSRTQLLNEIAKCDVVCANCHFERTHQRARAEGRWRLDI